MSNHAKLTIGDFVLDPSRNLLIGADEEVGLEPKVVDVLVALAARPGEVLSRDELIEAVWKTEFGADERLTRAISQLRKAFGDERGTARYIETVSKRGYRLVAPVSAFAAGDTTATVDPASHASATGENAPAPPPSQVGLTWQAYAAAGAFAALAVAGIAATMLRDSNSIRRPTLVAVLPFDDLSPQHEGKAFAEGLSEEILHALSKSSDLAVAARSSSFQFSTRQSDQAARAMKATHLVEGTVRRLGDRVRVSVTLKDAGKQTAVWSETFDRTVTQLRQVQDDIAWRVADALGARLARRRDSVAVDLDVYERYLRARDLLRLRELTQATEEFEGVVGSEPNFVRAWAGLAVARHLLALYSEGQLGHLRPELMIAAQEAVDRTLQLEPENGEALGVLGQQMFRRRRFSDAESLFDRAIAAGPSDATLLNWRSNLYAAVGRGREAMAERSRAHQVDRLSPAYANNLLDDLIATGRFAEARVMMEATASRPEWSELFVNDAERDLLAYSGDWTALAAYTRQQQFRAPVQFAETYALIGETASALAEKKVIDRLYFRRRWQEVANGRSFPRLMAMEYLIYVGDYDGAMGHLQAFLAAPRGKDLANVFLPFVAPLRNDRRLIALMDSVGLWDYWRESGHWPDFCGEPGLSYDCKMEALRLVRGKIAKSGDEPSK